ncbi:tRNA pseudouridine(38-40) synthase TruA [Chlamydiales bacterium]|nr:tRNA pseudouridine(38-40) synthase TruA [Chlamydiales bacterium]
MQNLFTKTESAHNWLLKIAYDGTPYRGWQIQPNALTIQQIIEEKLLILLNEPIRIIGSGRTDAGVHALEYTANFPFQGIINTRRLVRSLNALLPYEIRILDVEEVDLTFHARFSAKSKIYHYYITSNQIQLPFRRHFRTHVTYPLDINLIREASAHFVGTHDFTTFANSAHTGSAKNKPIKTLTRCHLIEEEEGFRIEMEADGFLYKMCRNIVGTLIDCGRKKRSPDTIPALFEAKDRKKAPNSALAHGLFFIKANY